MRDMPDQGPDQANVLPDMLRHKPPGRLKTIGVAALCVAAAVVALGVIGRVQADQSLKAWTSAQAVPTVKVINLNDGGTARRPGAAR